MNKRLLALLLCIASFLYSSCTNSTKLKKNVILLTLDGLRQDHLSLFGYFRNTSTNIDWIGENGIYFKNIIPTSCSTKASLTSLFTSMDYRYHHILEHNRRLHTDYLTLAEIFRNEGYITAGYSATAMITEELNYDQGFDFFEDFSEEKNGGSTYIRANKVAGKIITFLSKLIETKSASPFFIYAHLEEPHPPWFPPSPWLSSTSQDYETQPFDIGCTYVPPPEIFDGVSKEQKSEWIAKYDGAIYQADKQIGLIIKKLKENNLLENTIIAISTDHGYELLDRYAMTHGFCPFDEVARVFLVLYDGSRKDWDIDTDGIQGRIFDIGPTILAMCKIEIPSECQGIDIINNYNELPEFAFTAGYGSQVVRNLEYKLIHVDFEGKAPKPAYFENFGFMLFDLRSDPGETKDIKNIRPAIYNKLMGEYSSYLEDLDKEFVLGTKEPLSDVSKERLKSLGYIK